MDQVIIDSLKAGLLSQAGEQQSEDSDEHPSSSTFTRTVSRFSTRRGSRLLSRRQSDSATVRRQDASNAFAVGTDLHCLSTLQALVSKLALMKRSRA